jgi:hypothetical protein
VEAGGGRRRGRGQRLLYWFRTPPGVRVGRAALDDEAIRLLEKNNPDVQFDWARLLKEAVPEPPRRDRDHREGRDGRDRDRRERREPRQPRTRPMETSAAAAPPTLTPEAAEEMQELAEAAEARAAEHAEVVFAAERANESEPLEHGLHESEPEPEREREFSERSEPSEPPSAATARLGADGVSRLRTRYLGLKHALDEKNDLEADAKAELAAALERLNPDGWYTPDDVSAALEQYESIFERVRSVVGRHPRRRV